MTLLGDFFLGLFLAGPDTSAERWSPRTRVAIGVAMMIVLVATIVGASTYVIIAWT